MIKDDVRFIHARRFGINASSDPKYRHDPKGGMTFAWYLDSVKGLVLGFPAMCSENDLYEKSVGRKLAEDNLTGEIVQNVEVPYDMLRQLAIAEFAAKVDKLDINKKYRDTLCADFVKEVDDTGMAVMNCSWFERLVRDLIRATVPVQGLIDV